MNGTAIPLLAVIAGNGMLVQMFATDNSVAHSVAVDKDSGTLVVPVKWSGVRVYKMGLSSSTANRTATSSGRLRQQGVRKRLVLIS